MTTEPQLFALLKGAFPEIWFTRIETGTTSGVPDVNYCCKDGSEGWIELKIGVPRLKPSQVAWHTRAMAMNRRAYVLTIHDKLFKLYRTNKFGPIGTDHFTPLTLPLLRAKFLPELSSYLTMGYN